jgi:hypothetical protein
MGQHVLADRRQRRVCRGTANRDGRLREAVSLRRRVAGAAFKPNILADRSGAEKFAARGGAYRARRQFFLLFGLWPAGVLPAANGDGAGPPFLRFLSAFGFFFSLLLRI